MNEKEAREIVGRIEEKFVCNRNMFDYAKGYLEAIEKVKGLVDALRLAPCRCDPPSDNTCDRCVTLIKWGKGR